MEQFLGKSQRVVLPGNEFIILPQTLVRLEFIRVFVLHAKGVPSEDEYDLVIEDDLYGLIG
jgi:hypothetical protein